MEKKPLSDTKNTKIGELQSLDTGVDKWYGSQAEVKSDPIDDPGTGAAYVIRKFDFAFNPEVLKKIKDEKLKAPTKQELFNSVWPQLRIMLWSDGLVAVQEESLPPKIKVKKKGFTVVLVCMPRLGQVVVDKVKRLNDYLK